MRTTSNHVVTDTTALTKATCQAVGRVGAPTAHLTSDVMSPSNMHCIPDNLLGSRCCASLSTTSVSFDPQARVYQATRCVLSGAPLELPAVHFLCGHSFNGAQRLHDSSLLENDVTTGLTLASASSRPSASWAAAPSNRAPACCASLTCRLATKKQNEQKQKLKRNVKFVRGGIQHASSMSSLLYCQPLKPRPLLPLSATCQPHMCVGHGNPTFP